MAPKSKLSHGPSYCVKCRSKTANKESHAAQSASGKVMLRSLCSTCGTRKCMFPSKAMRGSGFFDDFLGGVKKGFNAISGPATQLISMVHPGAGAAVGAAGNLVNGLLGLTGHGVRGRKQRGKGIARAGGGIPDNRYFEHNENTALRPLVIGRDYTGYGSKRNAPPPFVGPTTPSFSGKGLLNDELSTNLHLKTRGR